MDNAERAVKGAAAAGINADEVRRLILAAQTAHKLQASLGLTEDTFDVWRKGVLWDTVRRSSFRQLGQAEFGKAMKAFLLLGGKDAPPVRSGAVRRFGKWDRTNEAIARNESSAEGDRRRAEWCLKKECRDLQEAWDNDEAQAMAYAVVLLRTIHQLPQGRELANATAKQIWAVVFTMRTRARQRLSKQLKAASLPQAQQGAQDRVGSIATKPTP